MAETNFEHYKDEIIKNYFWGIDRCEFKKKYILKTGSCRHLVCSECHPMVREWLDKPYEETVIEIDWSRVPVDTPVFVNNYDGKVEFRRHFKEYKDDVDCKFICYDDGRSSFTVTNSDITVSHWFNCRLAREEDIEKYRKK
jgi:hypothetical protein